MTNLKLRSRRKLSVEILGLLAISFLIALFLFQFLCFCSVALVDSVLSARDIVLTDGQLLQLDTRMFQLSLLASTGFFIVLFLFLLGERLSYIKEILKGIDALQSGQHDHVVPLEGSNELTQLAQAVNYLSASQKQIKEQERALAEAAEKLRSSGVTVKFVPCMRLCGKGPNIRWNGQTYHGATPELLARLVSPDGKQR